MFKSKEYAKEYYKRNKDKMLAYTKEYKLNNKDKVAKWTKKRYSYDMTLDKKIKEWKTKAKKRNIEWNLTTEYIKSIPMVCFYTGEELTVDRNKDNTISLDRIDSNKGYVEGNVVFTSWIINRAKHILSSNDFINMCNKVSRHNPAPKQ